MTEDTANPANDNLAYANLGRNEPCPCGSGKKYKRCHGVGAAPKVTPPKAPDLDAAGETGVGPGDFDPSKMDPQMMQQFAQMLQRLPKGQLQKLQGIMQRAMSGKDVSRESAEFERTLPVGFQEMMKNFAAQMPGQFPGNPSMEAAAAPTPVVEEAGMSEEEARKIVAAAAAEGKISQDQASELLAAQPEKMGGLSKLWRGVTGSKNG